MKIFNLAVKRNATGGKHLDLHIHGVIDGGWQTEDQDSAHVADLIAKLSEHRDAGTVHAYINSVGGSAFAGVALYNALSQHPGEVTCFVTGLAASAASLIAMAGKTCMCTGSMMMIHSPSMIAAGNAAELRKTADVLDKIQEALAGIYTKKTGKGLDEVNQLLDAETWMTADEAVAAGFANEVADAAPAHSEPDGDEDKNGNEPPGPEEPTAIGSMVVWNGVAFPKAALPSQIVAMAKPLERPAPVLAVVPTPQSEPPPAAITPVVNRAYLAEKAPELLAALVEEGRVAERTRLKEIDDLAIKGASDLVAVAKYGDKPQTAAELALAIVKAGQLAGAELLALRREESKPLVQVTPGAPDQTGAAAEARLVNAMVAGGNARRGGTER